MAKINSSIGSRTYQSGMREFVVGDEDDRQEDIHHAHQPLRQEINYQDHFRQRNEKASTQEKISDSAKKRIELLCGMTQITREVNIDSNNFILRSLKNKENRQCMSVAMKYEGTIEFPFEIRKQILAKSIISISGIDVESFLNDDSHQSRCDFIDELDDAITERLYQEYLLLSKEIKEKYSIKNEEQLKEVAEDLKK